MIKKFELPIAEPIYSTYQFQGSAAATIYENPSILNWYLNEVMILTCNKKFLSGFSSPQIDIVNSSIFNNPHLQIYACSLRFIDKYVNRIICDMLNNGHYIYFCGVDDYYIKGKSFYKERHISHDGLICGYDQEEKTYSILSYDNNWIYRKFSISQRDFNKASRSMFKNGTFSTLYAVKPKSDIIEFSAKTACKKIAEYLDSTIEKYPESSEGMVYGIVVHDYIAKYIEKLLNGSIPYEKMDWRVFRLIWEHKKVMLMRIQCIEKAFGLQTYISEKYKPLVSEANTMRMLYASHYIKRRDSVLPIIQKKLLESKKKEQELLNELLERVEEK